jgi:putative phosphoribosyl transferase
MLFNDRIDAGKSLAKALKEYAHRPDAIVIACPRGGVVVGYEIASSLDLPLDIVCPRKIGAPFNPELAIGAITETGEGIFSTDLIEGLGITSSYIEQAIVKEKQEAQWRLNHYRQGRPPRTIAGKCVILTDDGLATGSTMLAAIKTMRAEKAQKIVMAIPVAPPDTLDRVGQEVDVVVCLATPSHFYAVGQFYKHFDQTEDDEVISLLQKVKELK